VLPNTLLDPPDCSSISVRVLSLFVLLAFFVLTTRRHHTFAIFIVPPLQKPTVMVIALDREYEDHE
jgi:hypothetical protein